MSGVTRGGGCSASGGGDQPSASDTNAPHTARGVDDARAMLHGHWLPAPGLNRTGLK